MNTFFPPISILNRYHIGDTVIIEPIADFLSKMLGCEVFIQCRNTELLRHHPNVTALGLNEKPPRDVRTVDLSEALCFMPGESLGKMKNKEEDGKLAQMYKSAGLSSRTTGSPNLFLSYMEQTKAKEIRSLFSGKRVGVAISSRFGVKNWPYMRKLLKCLSREGYEVFIFAEGIGFWEKRLLQGISVYRVVDKSLREAMVWISAMDAMIGPDTGLMHIAGGLKVPIVVTVWRNFQDLYKPYKKCTILTGQNYGLRAISVRKVLKAVQSYFPVISEVHDPKVLIARCRGVGDVLMTLPALATLRSNDGVAKYVYATSPGAAKLLRGTKLVDEVIPLDYNHPTSGLPRLPEKLNTGEYTAVHNLINRVDFAEQAAYIPRTEMFAEMLDVKKIDYSLNWKIKPLYSWGQGALWKLHKAGLRFGEKYMALQYTSAGWSRTWPRERFIEFVMLAMKAGHRVVVLSDVVDEDLPEGVVNVTGQLTLEEYAGAVAESKILIGPDSSGVHLAGCMDKLAIGLFGSVDPKLRIAHYDTVVSIVGKEKCVPCNDAQRRSCREDPHCPICIWNIEPEEILSTAENLLSKGK